MNDITSIAGKVLLDRNTFVKLLSALEPKELDAQTTLFEVGYEKAKMDLAKVLSRTMGEDFFVSPATRMIKEIRRG